MPRHEDEPHVWTYPASPRGDAVDTYHGTAVPDPYRSLEADDAPDTLAWIAAQRSLSEAHLARLPERDAFRGRLAELWDFARTTPPERRGDWLFFQRNDGLQHQAVLYRQPAVGDREPQVVLDPNALRADGTTALVSTSLSDDGRYLAFNLAEGGSDWQVIRVLDVEQGAQLPDEVRWCRFTEAAWLPDGSGFYYARYPAPGEMQGAPPSTHQRVFLHRLGTLQGEDVLVYARPDAPDLGFHPIVSEDDAYLFLHVWAGTDERNRLYYRELGDRPDAPFVRLLDAHDAMYHLIGNDGSVLYLLTDLGAPNGRIVAIDLMHPQRDGWRELVPEGPDAIDSATLVGDTFLVRRLHHAHHRLERYALDGTPREPVALPAAGAVGEPIGRRRDHQAFATFESFLHPPTVLGIEAASGAVSVFHRATVAFDLEPFETRQIFVTSRDGARVPVFVTHARDLAMDGTHPTLLYGYGGFSVNMTPAFDPSRLAWLERGGVYAHAILRGGQEYGDAWHWAGMLLQKQNVFDDFIAAAQGLIDSGHTRPDRLAIQGRSNGGLLVAACMTQRPDLFGAVHCGVPVIDMLRYHRFTAGRYWVPEYGSADDDPEQFAALLAYAPLHRLRPGTAYPATIVTTADGDDRVVPMHARKFVAALQHADSGRNPLLLRADSRAGHGLGKPVYKVIDEHSDVLAFLWAALHG